MPEPVIVKPNITPEERLKRLNNIADVLSRIIGHKCKYIGTDEELNRVNRNNQKAQ